MPPSSSAITLEELSEFFHMPEKVVAAKMGICLSSLKKMCRAHGISRWPFRKLKSLERTIQKASTDSNSISVQLGKNGAGFTLRSASNTLEKSRSSSPDFRLDCEPVRSPKVESAVFDSATTHEHNEWPSFTISGVNMTELIITNWSTMWTIQHIREHIVAPLCASEMTISEDGAKACICFDSSMHSVQARKVCENACDLIRARSLAAEAHRQETFIHRSMIAQEVEIPIETLQASNPRFLEQPSTCKSVGMFPGIVEEDTGSNWMNLAAPVSTNRWVVSLLSPPRSCGSQSDGPNSFSSSTHSNQGWMSDSPCLVSC